MIPSAKDKRAESEKQKQEISTTQRMAKDEQNRIKWSEILEKDLNEKPLPLTYEIGDSGDGRQRGSSDPDGIRDIVEEILKGKGYKVSVSPGGWSGGVLTIK
jgi:hypothetical protein